ncbi:6-phosphogluconolactonase [Parasediminibacterium sp. JCM 36343]|uniref:6-phosphogluconolactonase n=1 Tax=Parasediminibacterium sp. JCM 36343 TaxID=3374279 RepID=UPI00397AB4C8
MQLHISDTKKDLVIEFANWLVVDIAKVLATQTRCTIALSGGSTPIDLFKLLVSADYIGKIDWEKIHIFWGDERDVPFTDDLNNAKHAFAILLNHVPIPQSQIHIMDTSLGAAAAAKQYEEILHAYFDNTPNSFDIVMLGMGDDGHTLSLFPGTVAVMEEHKWAMSFYLEAQEMNRITITAPITNKAAAICFLAAGKGKAATLKAVLEGEYQPMLYPSQKIKPVNGELHWFVDKEAAALL